MAIRDKVPSTLAERLASALQKAEATAQYLLDEGLITEAEYKKMVSDGRAAYQALLGKLSKAK